LSDNIRFKGNHILLITGAGTLGRSIVNAVQRNNDSYYGEIRVIDQSEEALWRLEEQMERGPISVKMFLGDIRDEERMKLAMRRVDTVIHTAALKHLRYTNYNPIECLKSNCEAVYKLIQLAVEMDNVKTFVNISTDKACNPDNIYGETKRIGETLTTWGWRISGKNFYSVRPGNFLDSHGSVFDRWREQRKGGQICVTDPKMNRFFIKQKDIGEFVYWSQYGKTMGGMVLVPMMSCLNMGVVADVMADKWNVVVGMTGADEGEKFDEEIIGYHEADRTLACFAEEPEHFKIHPKKVEPHINTGISTKFIPSMTHGQTAKFLEEIN
jgi:UDP-N-acetylglucosamine 4,6-dehydratase